MHTLVTFMGNFFVEELDKIKSKVEVLANQPPLEVHKVYANRNPELSYRRISIDEHGIRYHVSDIGHIGDVPDSVTLADRFYSEKEVDELRQKII